VSYLAPQLNALRESDAIVMDCDGTLVEISNSYDEAIYTTVELIFQSLTGRRPQRTWLTQATFDLRKSGGFNNDWDTVYAIVVGLLSGTPDEWLERVTENLEKVADKPLSLKSLLCARSELRDYDESEVENGLKDVVSYADAAGSASIDEGLEKLYRGKEKLELLKRVRATLRYPGVPGECLISGVFDELYLGSALYQGTYKLRPALCVSRGFIENESLIVRRDTLNYMKRRFPHGLGIATGRTRPAAEKSIGPVLREFFADSRALTFSDDLVEEYERRKANGMNVWPGKPDPYCLQRAIRGLDAFKRVIFVGDSMEDLKMCSSMQGFNDDLFFVGVYKHTINPLETRRTFMEQGAIAVLPTINELKELLGD